MAYNIPVELLLTTIPSVDFRVSGPVDIKLTIEPTNPLMVQSRVICDIPYSSPAISGYVPNLTWMFIEKIDGYYIRISWSGPYVSPAAGITNMIIHVFEYQITETIPATSILAAGYKTSSAGTSYAFGVLDFASNKITLTQASTTQTYGVANHPYCCKAAIVAGGAGTASGGSGAVKLKVTGTSFVNGVRTAADSEILVADITTMSPNAMYQTTKRWIGQVTFALDASGSTQTTYSATFNYGLKNGASNFDRNFSINGFTIKGTAGANDSSFNMTFIDCAPSGWTYAATGFIPGGATIADFHTDFDGEDNLTKNKTFAWIRMGMSYTIYGSTGDAMILRINSGSPASVAQMDISVQATIL